MMTLEKEVKKIDIVVNKINDNTHYIINNNINLSQQSKNEINAIFSSIIKQDAISCMVKTGYIKNQRYQYNTLVFNTNNTIFTIVNNKEKLEILAMNKNEDLIFNLYIDKPSEMTVENYIKIYNICKDLINQL